MDAGHPLEDRPPALDLGIPDAKDVSADNAQPIDTSPAESADKIVDADGTLRGYLVFANEVMAFEACGTTALIWANLQGWEKGHEMLPSLGPICVPTDGGMAPCPGTIYVELTGTVSPYGQYGQLNKYSQQIRVNEYLAASLTGPPDCPFLPPVYPN